MIEIIWKQAPCYIFNHQKTLTGLVSSRVNSTHSSNQLFKIKQFVVLIFQLRTVIN